MRFSEHRVKGMTRRSKAGSTKPRRRKAPAARRRSRVETIRGATSSASKEELRFALLRRSLSEARWHHRRAEEALRESEHKLHQIIDAVPSFLWSADPTGEPTYVNQRALDYSGMRFEEFKHGGWEAFIHPADFPGTMKAFGHAIEIGTSYETVHIACVGGMVNIVGTKLAVNPCAIGMDAYCGGMASPLTSMTPRRLKTGFAAAKPIWRKHRG